MNPETILKLSEEVRNLRDNLNDTNLLDTVCVNENTHSRILKMILSYSENGQYPFYESFLKIDKVARILPDDFQGGKPHFFNERDRIDLLIEGKDYAYAIIIENKVYDAVDRERQLERYLGSCIGRGIAPERLFALYLTKDGSKKVAEGSLTAKAMEILGVSSETQGRFAEINFKEDILRWLRESILLCEGEDHTQIKSAIIQYTDYVLGMFDEDDNTSRFQDGLTNLLVKYDIRTIDSYTGYIEAANRLSADLSRRRDEVCGFLARRFISAPLQDYCKHHNVELAEGPYSYTSVNIQMSIPGQTDCSFILQPYGGRIYYGISKPKDKENPIASAVLADNGFSQNDVWAAWRYPSPQDRQYECPATPAFWEVAVTGGGFVQFVIKAYEQTIKLLARERQGVR